MSHCSRKTRSPVILLWPTQAGLNHLTLMSAGSLIPEFSFWSGCVGNISGMVLEVHIVVTLGEILAKITLPAPVKSPFLNNARDLKG